MTFDTLVLAPFSQHGLSSLEHFGQVTYEPWTETQTLQDPEELGRRIAETGFAGLIVEADFLFDELFSSASPLRFAAVCRGALNHVDLDAATEHGVAVVHTPGRNAQAVAELVQGLVLSLARQIPRSIAYVQAGAWQDPTDAYIRFQGREVQGATLGIIGLGQIGRRVARL
ncbi:MAG: NAD(P)-dependent oxidoreductase, partial [Dehalococcoidia bacterium]